MTITTSEPQETAKTRKGPRTAAPTEPEPIKDSITVEDEPKDASKMGNDIVGVSGFLPSKKTARSPPQATAQPITQTKHNHDPPPAPRPATRTKRLQLSDMAKAGDDTDSDDNEVGLLSPSTRQPITSTTHQPTEPTMRQPYEMLSAINDMVTQSQMSRTNTVSKEKILKSIAELANVLMQMQEQSDQQAKECEKNTVDKSVPKPRSWAQIVAVPKPAKFDAQLEIAKRERLERLKNERTKTEVTISLRSASKDIQNDINALKDEDLTKMLEEHVNEYLKGQGNQGVKIKAWKPSKHLLKIKCRSTMDAASIKDLEWEKLLAGAKLTTPTYGVVIHGAPKYIIDVRNDNIDEIKETIELVNEVKVEHVRPLMRKPRNPQAPTESIVIFTKDAEEANRCINEGLLLGGRNFLAERYAPQYQIKQCFRCQTYGHRAETCTREARCGKCTKNHETRECNTNIKTATCVQCQGPHQAWHHSCPRRQKEVERLEIYRATLPTHFLC